MPKLLLICSTWIHDIHHHLRSIQYIMLDGRSRNLLFSNFIYQRLRPNHELRMNEKAKEMVETVLAKKEEWR